MRIQTDLLKCIYENLQPPEYPWNKITTLDPQSIKQWELELEVFFLHKESLFQKFPPNFGSASRVLRNFFDFLERNSLDYTHSLYSFGLKLESMSKSQEFSHLVYTLPLCQQSLIVKRCNLSVSLGTTGLSIWPVSLLLCDFFTSKAECLLPSTIEKTFSCFELGCGTGIASLFLAKMLAGKNLRHFVTLSDCDDEVLDLCRYNIAANNLEQSCSAQQFDWTTRNAAAIDADFVYASDILYDPGSFQPLAAVLRKSIHRNKDILIVFCTCIRNPDTWSSFLSSLSTEGLQAAPIADPPKQMSSHLPPDDTRLFQIVASQGSNVYSEIIKSNNIVLFTIPDCSLAKAFLSEHSLDYLFLELNSKHEMEQLGQLSGFQPFPKVFIRGKLIGGFLELQSTFRTPATLPRCSSGEQNARKMSASKFSQPISKAISSAKVFIFSKTCCPYCERAKSLLAKRGVPFSSMELDQTSGGEQLLEELGSRTGEKTVPRIFINGECVGGFAQLQRLDASGDEAIAGMVNKK